MSNAKIYSRYMQSASIADKLLDNTAIILKVGLHNILVRYEGERCQRMKVQHGKLSVHPGSTNLQIWTSLTLTTRVRF